ncbi:MAG: serine hydrolase [Lachnospiraceae bacterium]|nr:serine hydrolase [Lachnospiraceae bacterium]
MEGGLPLGNMGVFLKFLNRAGRKIFLLSLLLVSVLFTGCSGEIPAVPMLIGAAEKPSVNIQKTYRSEAYGGDIVLSFPSAGRPVPDGMGGSGRTLDGITAKAAFLFNITEGKVLYEKNCYEKIYPASTTKLLTAYFLLSYIKEHGIPLTDTYCITADNCGIKRVGAKLFGFRKGDVVSLELLLNALLVYSANDSAVAIIEFIAAREGASYDEIMQRMNGVAAGLGATHTNFTNSHGLHELGHKTTPYDLYLIFEACMGFEEFLPIVGKASYTASYTDANGTAKEQILEATNQYYLGLYTPPEGVTVLGGKTGSTGAAGDCFITLSSCNGTTYLSAVFGAASYEELYQQMNLLLGLEKED